MAKFCSKDCEEICDFCKHYRDEYRDIEQKTDEDGKLLFAGQGICNFTGENTDAGDGYKCEDFVCFKYKEEVS